MTEKEFWNEFVKSGKVVDYISYRNFVCNTEKKENNNASEHQGIDTQRTEYR